MVDNSRINGTLNGHSVVGAAIAHSGKWIFAWVRMAENRLGA
jgi:hypothetical protein